MKLHISQLTLQNFRCYQQMALELPSGLSVIVGPNGSGKTSLLEAVLLLATTKSSQTSHDYELVCWGRCWARVSGRFQSADDQILNIAVTLRGRGKMAEDATPPPSYLTGAKHLEIDGQAYDSAAEVVGRAPAVFFTPDDLQIIKGAPNVRRRFLNVAISQITPRYLDDLHRYRRALRQRNELLKQVSRGEADGEAVAPWTSELVEIGVRISADRERFVQQLDTMAPVLHETLSGGTEQLAICYDSALAGAADDEQREDAFHEKLEEQERRELELGATQVGPHRDDIVVRLNGRAVRRFGSQGQQRTAALAVKLAEAQVIGRRRDQLPVLLLDDCLSELDPQRAACLLELLDEFDQVLVTSATATDTLRSSQWASWHDLAEEGL